MRPSDLKRVRSAGFSLLEVLVVSAMMGTVLAAVGVGLRAGHVGNEEIERRSQLTIVASEIMDRLFRIEFGHATDVSATPAQLAELFDADADLGTASLCSLRSRLGARGHTFSIDRFPWGGTFEVRVDGDLNGDGDASDPREGRGDLLRITILHDGVPLLESMRASNWTAP